MHYLEKECSSLLHDMLEDGMSGVKVSFEDEGATFEDVVRLKNICGDIDITLKIGGPEAIRDLKDSLIIGVNGLVAPMVESVFGLKKFIGAVNAYISEEVKNSLTLSINIETITAVKCIDDILRADEAKQLHSITVGRADLSSSQGKNRNFVNSEEILAQTQYVFEKTKSAGLKTCLGGTISIDSQDFLITLYKQGLLDKFETRYIMFNSSALKNLSRALNRAVNFELAWLKNKQKKTNAEIMNDKRIEMIEKRQNDNQI